MCETRQTRRHSPSRVARTRQTRRHSPSRVARTRQTRRHSPSRVARTRQTCERRVWWVLREFSESGEFGECRLDRFIHKKYVICAKNDLSYHACLRRAVLRGLARLADIPKPCCADSPNSPTFAKPCCADSPNSPTFAKTFTEYSPDSPTFAKRHFWEKCDSPRHIRTSNSPFSRIWGEWPLLS